MWKRLTFEDLQEVLAYDEIEKLNNLSLSANVEDICQKQIDTVADTFRGAFSSKGYIIDVREHYIAPEYKLFVLYIARQYIWSRFPNSNNIAIDEIRKKEYENAWELLKNPYIGVSYPDYSNDPVLSGDTSLNSGIDGCITVPWLKFPNYDPVFNTNLLRVEGKIK